MSVQEFRISVMVVFATSFALVCGSCIKSRVCDNPDDIFHSNKADPDNHQQLLNAFYPINRASPSSVIIAYFINYTDPLPEECSLGTYPWKV